MTENVSDETLGSLFFQTVQQWPSEPQTAAGGVDPLAGPAGLALDAVALRRMDDKALQEVILLMLACLQRRPAVEVANGPLGNDGTLGLDSMTAVWVIATIGKAFGCKLVRLSEVEPFSLRSVGGLASLIRTAICRVPAMAGAA